MPVTPQAQTPAQTQQQLPAGTISFDHDYLKQEFAAGLKRRCSLISEWDYID